MPELILKFNLPEEQNEADMATSALNMFCAIHDFKNDLRSKLKHGNYTDEEYKIYEEINESFNTILEEHNVLKFF